MDSCAGSARALFKMFTLQGTVVGIICITMVITVHMANCSIVHTAASVFQLYIRSLNTGCGYMATCLLCNSILATQMKYLHYTKGPK